MDHTERDESRAGSRSRKNRKNAGMWLIIVVSLLVCAAAAVGLVFALKYFNGKDPAHGTDSVSFGTGQGGSSGFIDRGTSSRQDAVQGTDQIQHSADLQPSTEQTTAPRTPFNPFDHATVSFSGLNGGGIMKITADPGLVDPEMFYAVEFTSGSGYVRQRNGLYANGEKVTVYFDYEQFEALNPEYVIYITTMDYIVSGLVTQTDDSLPEDLRVPGSADGYILPDSDTTYYSEEFLSTLSDKQLRYARNEIVARHGRMFTDVELQSYFGSRSWYEPLYAPEVFDGEISSQLNEYEIANQAAVNRIETARHTN